MLSKRLVDVVMAHVPKSTHSADLAMFEAELGTTRTEGRQFWRGPTIAHVNRVAPVAAMKMEFFALKW
jgi:hypothetical protein